MRLIVLYGPSAVGKYTVAKAVAEKTGYKLFHNHLTIDLLRTVFEFGSPDFFRLSQQIRLDILEEAARQDLPGVVFTFVYERRADDGFIRELIRRVGNHGGEVVFIQLSCAEEELLRRVKGDARKVFLKVKSEDGLLRMLAESDIVSAIEFVDSVKIDSTSLTEVETIARVFEVIEPNL